MKEILLRLLHRWNQLLIPLMHSFRKQLAFGFVIASVLPVFFLGVIIYLVSYSITEKNLLDSIHNTHSQVNNAISNRFYQMEKVANSLQSYVYDLVTDEDELISAHLSDAVDIRKYISSLVYHFDFYDIKVYLPSDVIFSNEGLTFFTLHELDEVNPYIPEYENNKVQWALLKNQKPSILRTGGATSAPINFIACFKSVNELTSDEIEYVYFIEIREREIARFFDTIYSDEGIISYLIDSKGTIISHPDESEIGKAVDTELLSIVVSGDEERSYYHEDQIISSLNEVTGWYIVTQIPEGYITSNISALNRIVILSLFMIMVFDIIIVRYMHKKVSHKIEVFSDLIGRLPENMDFSQPLDLDKLFGAEPEYPDEFDQVILLLKKMSVELHENIENNITIMKNAEKLKLQLLQLKINPHFLYNILESIKTSQSIGRVEIANEMISKLAKFYRLSLRKGDELISIHDELEISRLYLDIEKLCREDYLLYEIQCDEGIQEFLIPKFTLQPLLENCVLHALIPSGGRLQISISIRFSEENILIEIRDNGQGISPHILNELNEILRSKSVDVNKFYGISNVNARLAYYTDRESALEICSNPGVGTTVTISLRQLI